ncbi:MAG: Flp pilus assembly complex ATPase component TadA, partial [Ruminiclostridium sp.]|nr:Flp pilus assembly complex ATPase component TadA [Ruminiclostridium sp.]
MTIDQLVNFARSKNASDVHLTVGAPTAIRINGELKKFDMSDDDTNKLILSMLSAEQERKLGENIDVDFSFTCSTGGRQRVNVYHQNGGKLAAAVRLLNEHVPSFRDIMLPQAAIDLTQERKGLILVTGPTGSGKSTTLATMVDQINNTRAGHILTIEDPVEYIYEPKKATIHQRELGTDVLDFNGALRSGLR